MNQSRKVNLKISSTHYGTLRHIKMPIYVKGEVVENKVLGGKFHVIHVNGADIAKAVGMESKWFISQYTFSIGDMNVEIVPESEDWSAEATYNLAKTTVSVVNGKVKVVRQNGIAFDGLEMNINEAGELIKFMKKAIDIIAFENSTNS